MIKCPNCNKELEDGALFCDECGTKIEEMPKMEAPSEAEKKNEAGSSAPETVFCSNCGTKTTTEFEFCPNCGANVKTGEMPAQAQQGAAPVQMPVQMPAEQPKKSNTGLIIGVLAACAVLLIGAVLCVFAFMNTGKSNGKMDYLTYVKDKEIYYSNMGKKAPAQVTERLVNDKNLENSDLESGNYRLARLIVKSADGKKLFYPDKISESDDGYTIYVKELSKLTGEPVKIDSDIYGYVVNDSATTMIYLKGGDSLYLYNVKKADKEKIAGDVENVRASEDCKKLYYSNDDDTLYYWEQGKDKAKVDSDVTDVCYISDDFKTVYYLKEDALYKKVSGKDKEKLASEVTKVVNIYDSGELYYVKESDKTISYMDIITDDLKDEDANMKEPDYPWSRYYYNSDEEYEKAQKKYEEWTEKRSRDYIREYLESADNLDVLYELHYYDGKNDSVVSDMADNDFEYASDNAVIMYATFDSEKVEKIKLSKLAEMESSTYEEVTKKMMDGVSVCVAAKDNVTELSIDLTQDDDFSSFKINDAGSQIMFLKDVDDEKDEGDLYTVDVKNGQPSEPKLYDDDVHTYAGTRFAGDHIIYYKNYKDGKADLYIDGSEADFDASTGTSYNKDNDKIFFYVDYDSEKSQGTLRVYSNGKTETIANDVHTYRVLSGEEIVYISDFSQKSYKGDLYLYRKGKAAKIDEDVVALTLGGTNRTYQGGLNYYGW